MRHLCDSNVLLALVLANHPHHTLALKWFQSLGPGETVGLCRATQLSFLRLLTTEAILKRDTQTNAEAISVWNGLAGSPRCEFLFQEPSSLESKWLVWSGLDTASPKVWMDAFLAAFAMGHGLRLVTFDRGFEPYRKQGLDLLLLTVRAARN
jgi:toxin-antitoxin system PIN domain toxin